MLRFPRKVAKKIITLFANTRTVSMYVCVCIICKLIHSQAVSYSLVCEQIEF